MNAINVREQTDGAGGICRAILDRLPDWFGFEETNAEYVALAQNGPSLVASVDGKDVGILLLQGHGSRAAEVYLLAVMPEHHRGGIGTALLRDAETRLARKGVEFLDVMTLSDAHPDEGYKKTRKFYEAYGFARLHDFPDLWSADQPALQYVKVVRG